MCYLSFAHECSIDDPLFFHNITSSISFLFFFIGKGEELELIANQLKSLESKLDAVASTLCSSQQTGPQVATDNSRQDGGQARTSTQHGGGQVSTSTQHGGGQVSTSTQHGGGQVSTSTQHGEDRSCLSIEQYDSPDDLFRGHADTCTEQNLGQSGLSRKQEANQYISNNKEANHIDLLKEQVGSKADELRQPHVDQAGKVGKMEVGKSKFHDVTVRHVQNYNEELETIQTCCNQLSTELKQVKDKMASDMSDISNQMKCLQNSMDQLSSPLTLQQKSLSILAESKVVNDLSESHIALTQVVKGNWTEILQLKSNMESVSKTTQEGLSFLWTTCKQFSNNHADHVKAVKDMIQSQSLFDKGFGSKGKEKLQPLELQRNKDSTVVSTSDIKFNKTPIENTRLRSARSEKSIVYAEKSNRVVSNDEKRDNDVTGDMNDYTESVKQNRGDGDSTTAGSVTKNEIKSDSSGAGQMSDKAALNYDSPATPWKTERCRWKLFHRMSRKQEFGGRLAVGEFDVTFRHAKCQDLSVGIQLEIFRRSKSHRNHVKQEKVEFDIEISLFKDAYLIDNKIILKKRIELAKNFVIERLGSIPANVIGRHSMRGYLHMGAVVKLYKNKLMVPELGSGAHS